MALTFEQLGLTIEDSTGGPALAPVKARNEGVGELVKHLILAGMCNKDIVEAVAQHYGNNNTTYACVAWYRNNLKKG